MKIGSYTLTDKFGIKSLTRRVSHYKNMLTDHHPKILILTYHRVLPRVESNPVNTLIPLDIFVRQLKKINEQFPIISLSDALKQCQSGQAKAKAQVVLTFDDGYLDNYEVVFPVLIKMGLPASFFIIIDDVGKNRPVWDWEFINILDADESIKQIEINQQRITQKKFETRRSFMLRAFHKLKFIDINARENLINSLKSHSKNFYFDNDLKNSCMTWKQIIEMSNNAMDIGSHSMFHRSLTGVSLDKAAYEIKKSKEIIEAHINKPCLQFAFPFGSKDDFNYNLINCVRESGFKSCLLNIHGYNHIEKNKFLFKRIIMDESININCLLG